MIDKIKERGDRMKRIIIKVMVITLLMMLLPLAGTQSRTLASTMKADQVIAEGKSYLGVPYLYAGTTPDGFDCSGFLVFIFNKVGIELPRTAATQFQAGVPVEKSALVPGDLVFFEKTYDKDGITHSGMYIGDNQFISATTSKGVKIDALDNPYWGPKYVGAKRVLQSEFTDLAISHPAYPAVTTLQNNNIINGVTPTKFAPEAPITRGQAAAIVNRILKKEPKNIYSFPDVATTSWYAKDIAAVKEAGIISGYPNGTFKPNAHITRAEMAIIIQRAFQLQTNQYMTAGNIYKDVQQNFWAYDAIMTLYAIDTTNVFKVDQFNASEKATRAVFVIAIHNALTQ